MISYSRRFLFVHINKTAGTSIEHALNAYGRKKINDITSNVKFKHSQHFILNEYKEYLGVEYNKYYKFTVVRNPWDRVVSYYHSGAIQSHLSFTDWVIDRYKHKNFIDYHRMYMPCSTWFNKDEINRVIKYENINIEFSQLCSELQLDAKLEKHNMTLNRSGYQDYYINETRQIIHDIFIDDINQFNYKF
jgi:chondroitin 4-sulfotransferase 11